MSTQVQLFNTPLRLVSIPIDEFPKYVHGILKLLLKTWREELLIRELEKYHPSLSASSLLDTRRRQSHLEDNTISVANTPAESTTPSIEDKCDMLEEFVNVTITPVECSVVCPTELLDIIWPNLADMEVSQEEYVAIQVDGEGTDTGSRVLQISAPLASNDISLFFLATYYSDYVLVPIKAKKNVLKALKERGFQYANTTDSYVLDTEFRAKIEYPEALVARTFDQFAAAGVTPNVDMSARLILTGSRHTNDSMYMAIVKAIVNPPSYFSITLSNNEMSLMLQEMTVGQFPENSLQGSLQEYVIPVTFDLANLPESSTGIVSGVASKIKANSSTPIHMSYLSTAKSGLVLVSEEDATKAVNSLN